MDDQWLAGVDVCSAGWLVAYVHPDGDEVRMRVLKRFADVLGAPEQPVVVAVDIPIGLPDQIGRGGRPGETAVRRLLGARQSSVFATPSRKAVYAESGWVANVEAMTAAHARASEVARATSDPPKGVSIQAFCLFPKIREVDELVRGDAALAGRVFETHPEAVFWRLNGEVALVEPKKMRGQPFGRGIALRQRLLGSSGLPAAAIEMKPLLGAGEDDMLDALACAVTARRIHAKQAKPYPDPPEQDGCGLTMAIWV